ncbi:tRNA-splicing endonuclease subunit Sen54-like isoform X1 [Amphibalanus amphitrite]|uniref:tRNA-splicing endonuclease subunit Sen54-like isoform X1 n=1 Tax=Amphibalanus amphitrite TaxID=1232801 RepID=UPI001C8FFF70|nr:tRNA-splicing endonuclease subunit Sen54-like isoform X1 [Amphibalanus amphitrite]
MDEDVIASPEVLLRMAQGGSRSLPESGEKWSETPPPEDGWLAAEQERARTEELFSLLAEPLVVKRSELVTAAWLRDEDRAELSAVPGKFWQYMGYEEQRRKFLRWEEAVMLCEMGVIQMTSDGQPCSLQEVRARVLSSDPDRERQYRLYAHLTRLGYRPVRHGSSTRQNRATDYERKIRLDQYTANRSSKRHQRGSSSGAVTPEPKQPRADAESSDPPSAATAPENRLDSVMVDGMDLTGGDHTGATAMEIGDSPAAVVTPEHQQRAPPSPTRENSTLLALKRLDFSAERCLFPHVPIFADSYMLRAPPAELLPPGVQPRNHWYTFDLAAARRGRLLELSKKNRPGDRYPSCLPVIGTPVRNWAEFKQKAAELAASPKTPASAEEPSESLVPPGWRGSPAELLARLQLAPPPPPPAPGPEPVYDVYPSDAPFRKSAPPLPEFRVFIVRPEDRVAEISAVPTDRVPLCAAVLADVGPPALYTVVTGRLPVDSSVLDQSL